MEDLTRAEKASLYYQILERCNDWQEIYKIAIGPERFNNLTDKAKQSASSRWKTSHRIQKAKEEIERNLKAWIDEERAKAVEEAMNGGETESPKKAKRRTNNGTDFLNRDEFLQFLNDRANEVEDDKLRNDILKMLSDNLRYKEADKENTTEIQRFYTPMLCESCEIYNKCKDCKMSECPKATI